MNTAGSLPPQPWMTAPETEAVLAALTAKGAEIRFVGGCVRDAILGRPVNDIDIATHDPPEAVMRLIRDAGLKAVPTGIEHGTITAIVGDAHFEITTLREDVETDGRHARVAFTDDWTADAGRRDFTMNALFLAPDGRLYDPVGGLADLRAGRVRFVGEAAVRIREDVLRLLRFFRFQAHYGTPPPDADGLAACRALAHLLPTLSAERVAAELLKLLGAPAPAEVLELMRREGVLAHVLPEAAHFGRLSALARIEADLGENDAIRRLAAVVDVDESDAAGAAIAVALARRLKLSNLQRDRLAALAGGLPDFAPEPDAAARRRWLYRHDAALYRDLSLLHWARRLDEASGLAGGLVGGEEALYRVGLEAAGDWDKPRLPLGGAEVAALGVAQGPRVGALLARLEDWWVDGDFQAGREACLEHLSALVEAEAS